ncbi:MAG: hypothetical protein V2A78_08380 [bacterium]
MNKTKLFYVVVVAILLFSVMSAPAQASRLEFSAGIWSSSMTGSYNDGTNSLDLKNDLGFSNFSFLVLGAKLNMSDRWALSLGYTGSDKNAVGTLNKALTFFNVPYQAGQTLDTRIKLSYFDIGLERNLFRKFGSELNFILDVKITSLDLTGIAQQTQVAIPPLSQNGIPIPQIGFSGKVGMGLFDAHAKFLWLGGSASNYTASISDLTAGIGTSLLLPGLSASLDYHILDLRGKDTSNNQIKEALLNYSGPQLSLNYRF